MSKPIYNGQYFVDYPQNILGVLYTHNPSTGKLLTDAYGNPKPEVRGSLENAVGKIVAPDVMRYEHVKPGNIATMQSASAALIQEVIQKTIAEETAQKSNKYTCSDTLQCLSETILRYNTDREYKDPITDEKRYYTISREEIRVWITYQDEHQLQQLEASKPKQLIITTDTRQKLYLSPFDKIWNEIEITTLTDGSTIDRKLSIGSIFYEYFLNGLEASELQFEKKRATAYGIYKYWIEKDTFPRGTDEIEKAAIKRNTTIVGQILFDRFLLEMLTEEDKGRIAALWNSQRNNFKQIEYYKVPIGFEISKKFKNGALELRQAQLEGVAFMSTRGTGIVAYDVGVGKTMTAITAMGDGFGKGLFKRPLVVVPQKVYRKWIAEINGVRAEKEMTIRGKKVKAGTVIAEGILPHIKVIDYDNLGVAHIDKARDKKKKIAHTVPEYSVTMVTYEGLMKIGFNQSTEGTLTERLVQTLSQGESGRGKALSEQKIEDLVYQALEGTELNIEEMGIDAIIVDEGHNFRNLFMEIKGDVGRDGEREQKNFLSGSGGTPSQRALSLFMLNAYIQDNHNYRNTFGLTATPFTNRATEIYSMLSLYDYEGLKLFDCYNIAQFCTAFIDESMEYSWTAAGKFEPKAVIRGYNNLPILQSLVFRSIIYKTGEDANIQRPDKVILPLYADDKGVRLEFQYMVDTKLRPTTEQEIWMQEITAFARNGSGKLAVYYPPKEGKIPGQTLIALNAARTVTFSPYALNLGGRPQYDSAEITPEKFVDGSPKIKYVCECIRTVKKYHEMKGTPVSGQIIYSDRGTDWFLHIKQYLVSNVGFSDKEVEIFHGGVSQGKRETIKEKFLSNEVKVIIGSSTMREGVDLQNHCSVIYPCYLDWNPTDLHQLFGRGWRFGNKFSHIRVVVPLIENSSDVFTWQKLSEKMSRLNSIWTKADGTKMFEESELNAEELKKGLINDPSELARYEIDEQVETLKSEIAIVDGALKSLSEAQTARDNFGDLAIELEGYAKRKNPAFESGNDAEMYRLVKDYIRDMYGYRGNYSLSSKLDTHKKYKKRLQTVQEKGLKNYKLSVFDDFTVVIDDFQQRKLKLAGEMAEVSAPENRERLTEKYRLEKEQEAAQSKSITERVNQFQRLNYLLDCFYSVHTCDIYGRVHELTTGQSVEVVQQPKVEVVSSVYSMSDGLARFMPLAQRALVRDIITGEEGEDYAISVLRPLEQQVALIPHLKATESVPAEEKIIYAHFFLGGSDWYIAEWDGKDELFGYAVLNDDWQMSEWGYISLKELHGVGATQRSNIDNFKVYAELDFYWKEVPFEKIRKSEIVETPVVTIPEPISTELEEETDILTEVITQPVIAMANEIKTDYFRLKFENGIIQLFTEYNPDVVTAARKLNGKWLGYEKAWQFDERDTERVKEFLLDIFGTDGVSPVDLVDVKVFYDKLPSKAFQSNYGHSVFALGRQLAHRKYRDSKVQLGNNVTILDGYFNSSGGSVKNPRLEGGGVVFLVRDVPRIVLEKDELNCEGCYEILEPVKPKIEVPVVEVITAPNEVLEEYLDLQSDIEYEKEILAETEKEIPAGIFYVKAPATRTLPEKYLRVSPDEVGGFVAGYALYEPTGPKKLGYLEKRELLANVANGMYIIVTEEQATGVVPPVEVTPAFLKRLSKKKTPKPKPTASIEVNNKAITQQLLSALKIAAKYASTDDKKKIQQEVSALKVALKYL